MNYILDLLIKLGSTTKAMLALLMSIAATTIKRLYHTIHAALMFCIIFLPIILLATSNTFGLSPILLVLITIFNTYVMYEDLK